MLTEERINELSWSIHNNNKEVGWWDDPNRCLYEVLQLVSTEVAEATEGARKDRMDDHLPHRKMEEVELADTLIRLLDLGGHLKIFYKESLAITHYALKLPHCSVGRQHLIINNFIISMADALESNQYTDLVTNYSSAIEIVLTIGKMRGYDIEKALEEKVAYNLQRPDHKRDNRAKEGGKAF